MYLKKFKKDVLRQITPLKFCTIFLSFYGVIPPFEKKYSKLLNSVFVTTTLSLCCIVFWFTQKGIQTDTRQYNDVNLFGIKLYFYETVLITLSVYFRFITNRKEIVRRTRDAEYLATLSTFKGNWFFVLGRLLFPFAKYLYIRNLINTYMPKSADTIMFYFIVEGVVLLLSEIYIQIIFLLRHEYGRIKMDLAEWIESYNKNPELASEYRLLQIQRRHGILCHLANNLDKIYSLEIFLYVTKNITFILMIIIASRDYANIEEAFTATNFLLFIDKPFNIIYPCLVTDRLRRTMIETEKVIYGIRVDKCDPELFNTLTLISLQLKYRKPRFDCGGFVKMDIGFLESIVKVLISYAATLAQLSKNRQLAKEAYVYKKWWLRHYYLKPRKHSPTRSMMTSLPWETVPRLFPEARPSCISILVKSFSALNTPGGIDQAEQWRRKMKEGPWEEQDSWPSATSCFHE